ncbi:hypothetical protein [Nocardia asiatica]|uniref:hypothetical protein n=1 Tax=Nocardia asiatica TaxID=209252 RepID=UPI003EE1EA80
MEPTTEVVTARPAPALAAFIDRYVGYRMSGFAAGLHRGLPSRHMTFIVAIGPTMMSSSRPIRASRRRTTGAC